MLNKVSTILIISTALLSGCAYNPFNEHFTSNHKKHHYSKAAHMHEMYMSYTPKFYNESLDKYNFTIKDLESYKDLNEWLSLNNKEHYSGVLTSNEKNSFYNKTLALLKKYNVDFNIFTASEKENVKVELIGTTKSVIECNEFHLGCSNNRNLFKMVSDKRKLNK